METLQLSSGGVSSSQNGQYEKLNQNGGDEEPINKSPTRMQWLQTKVGNISTKVRNVPSRIDAIMHKDYDDMTSSSSMVSYANERPHHLVGGNSSGGGGGGGSTGDADEASDPARGGFFAADYKKHEDLKSMLDSNKDGLKLEAMKRIIGMIAKGKDASDLFAAVVKNVVSKNIEIKKLVYVYLVRYAEEQQDLALLSISTFQKALKDPNQFIRASALRVLSSIRVTIIIPIMMLALKDSVTDMSPYVRKTAAHAIPKMYSLDPEQRDQLIEVIEKLLSDKTTLVAGSVVMAFEEVCPERIDLVHKNFRKLCNLLIDVEEWGQISIINMLTRYARTQFLDPNKADYIQEENEKSFYGSEDDEKKEDEGEEEGEKKIPYVMDADHRLLLRSAKPLLQSRNSAVVMAVAQLYHHIAPKSEVGIVAKALVRLLRGHREVQSIVLSNIATLSAKRRGMFEPYLKSFFVRSNDPTHIRLLKLEILTNIAGETSISTILREFQTYVTSSDRDFVASTIQAIGRCASNISEVTDSCMNGLMGLMSNRDEAVVAESVVVIRKLLQMNPTEHKEIIRHMAKLADAITIPMARASILWLIGEYSEHVPKIAPDVLRKMAKNFINEEDIVKLQVLNLGAKLYLTNSKQTKLLFQYVLNLAKYDQNYDIRDRSRFLRHLIFPGEKGGALSKHAKKIFLASKPAPVLESVFKDRDQYQLGSLSHVINSKANGYIELPNFPDVAPDPTVRNVEEVITWSKSKDKGKKARKPKSFYSSSSEDDDDEDETSSDEGSSSESDSESGSESGSESDSGSEASSAESEASNSSMDTDRESSESESEVSESDSSSSDSDSDSSVEKQPVKKSSPTKRKTAKKEATPSKKSTPKKKEPEMQLLDFGDDVGDTAVPAGAAPPAAAINSVLIPTIATDLQGLSLNDNNSSGLSTTGAMCVPSKTYELLNRMNSQGLTASYMFKRRSSIFSTTMVAVEITFTNNSDAPIQCIKIGEKKLQAGMTLHEFKEITNLESGDSTTVSTGIDFCDTIQPANFEICITDEFDTCVTESRKYSVSVKCPVGELIQPAIMNERDFQTQQGKLAGMNENSEKVDIPDSLNNQKAIMQRVGEVANVQVVPPSDPTITTYRFAGKTISTGTPVLVTVKADGNKSKITVNCEKMIIGNMLPKDIKKSIQKL
ncbi:AP-3 complex subunit beta-2-like isoform X2 [Antedon mediterranea]|uniref:AP-3 complex subunit beta-2-like isoform X2 n=1 Tax=Antedon mediterranea TaxID=105859 RepID=UPI003AF989E8